MKIKKSEIIWNITKETALSIIIALVAYILLSPLLIAIIYPDDPPGHRDFAPLYYCITIIYAISFNLIYIKKSSENAALETINKFDAVEDLKKVHKRRRQNSAHLLCGNACALYHRKSVPAYRESVDIYFLLPVCDFTEYPDTRFK